MTMDNQRGAMEIFDTDVNPTKREELIKIIRWAAKLGDEAESQSLELKSQLSFERTGGARTKSFAKIIKFILGASNRDEYKAAKAFQGYGVMLIGVSKEGIIGNESEFPEEHEFREHAEDYFGSDVPKFSFYPVEVEGKKILAIVVYPPKNGQPIYICSKDFNPQDEKDEKGKPRKSPDALKDGAVYYRESSSTKAATSYLLRELIKRYKQGNRAVRVGSEGSLACQLALSQDLIEYYRPLAEAHATTLEEKIRVDQEQQIRESSQVVTPPVFYSYDEKPSLEKQLKAAQNYQDRIEESLLTLKGLVLPLFEITVTNCGTESLVNPRFKIDFGRKVNVQQCVDAGYESEVYPYLPTPVGPADCRYRTVDVTSYKEFDLPEVLYSGDSHLLEKMVVYSSDLPESISVGWTLKDQNLSKPLSGSFELPVFSVDDVGNLYDAYEQKRRLGDE
ncbi:MAG: ATP-binding protein [Rothia sp. (in: high G+C Gram-positive bacteria)]|nr:ATP-binding protein [Rothia sp. (in: high G+C Gram-positive bacteria)]